MHWKFFELPKFIKQYKGKDITKENPLKEQWLNFLVKCSEQTEIPENVDDIIKKGYEIMKTANWTQDQRILYWKQKANEADEIMEQKRLQDEAKKNGFEEGIQTGFEEGIEKGTKQGKLKGEISKVKDLLEFGISPEQIISKLKFLTSNHVEYIKNHTEEYDSDICNDLGLMGSLSENL